VYNIHKTSIKRFIEIKDIGGLSKTIPPSKATEFTIHVPSKYDYRFSSARRDQIVDIIKRVYITINNSNCPIFCIQAKDLKDFTTTEKDMKKSISRFPTSEYRNFAEDLLDNQTPQLKKSQTSEKETEDYDSKQDIRKKQLTAGSTDTGDDETDTDSQDNEVKQSMNSGAKALFNRNKFPAKLEDFKIKKMIGKGTFGKVYLVELSTQPGKLYAMKCIRKDIIIENEQMDNI